MVGSVTYLEVLDLKSSSLGPEPGPLHREKLYLVDPDPLRTEIQGPESFKFSFKSGKQIRSCLQAGPEASFTKRLKTDSQPRRAFYEYSW